MSSTCIVGDYIVEGITFTQGLRPFEFYATITAPSDLALHLRDTLCEGDTIKCIKDGIITSGTTHSVVSYQPCVDIHSEGYNNLGEVVVLLAPIKNTYGDIIGSTYNIGYID